MEKWDRGRKGSRASYQGNYHMGIQELNSSPGTQGNSVGHVSQSYLNWEARALVYLSTTPISHSLCGGGGVLVVLIPGEHSACCTVGKSGLQRPEEAETDNNCYKREDLAKLVLSSYLATIRGSWIAVASFKGDKKSQSAIVSTPRPPTTSYTQPALLFTLPA